MNLEPRLGRCFRNRPGEAARPAALPGVMRVGPTEDLIDRKPREVSRGAPPTLLGEEPAQRRTAGEPPRSRTQVVINPAPVFVMSVRDRAGLDRRPTARALSKRVAPGQYFRDRERGTISTLLHSPPSYQQGHLRATAIETAGSVRQRSVQSLPRLLGGFRDRPRLRIGPVTVPLEKGVGPGQDLLHGERALASPGLFGAARGRYLSRCKAAPIRLRNGKVRIGIEGAESGQRIPPR